SGIAHFLEHLMFKGTDKMDAGEFSATVSANGGTDNAFTSYDYTAYYQRVAADRLDLMMQMEADRMVNLDLTEDDILVERDVIIEERNQRTETNPSALYREQANAALFQNHRYGVPVIGWRHEMSNLTLSDALAYYKQFYAPNNAVLIVAGDVVSDEVLSLAKSTYGQIPANSNHLERKRPIEPPHFAPRRIEYADERVSQPYVVRSYLAPERNSGDQRPAAALALLADILGDGQASVLQRKLQFETQEALYASASYSGVSLDTTSFAVYIVPSADVSLEDAEAALDRAISEFMEEGVDQAQLDRLKTQYRAAGIYAQDSVTGLANAYGRALTSGLTLQDIHEWPDIIQSITAEEILAAARGVFDLNSSVTGWIRK
ncbi:MAG: M16 family metallopeptidase, partial [Paracoccaceae bacterium]